MRHWQSIDYSQIPKCLNFMRVTKARKIPAELAQYFAKITMLRFLLLRLPDS